MVAARTMAAIVSEEMDEPRLVTCGTGAPYVLCIDPLDGSSNSDVNGVVATIFGVYRPARNVGALITAEFLQSGRNQVAAGSIMYGPSTILVYTTGSGVHGFTLDHDIGEFLLIRTAPRIVWWADAQAAAYLYRGVPSET